MMGVNSRSKRTIYDEDKTIKDEPPYKSQRLYSPHNENQNSQEPFIDIQFENCEITEYNYKKISASTIYKKLQVLEIRDRLLRATTTQPLKDINVDEIKPLEGTCYDMCPEKERLLRIHGNMVSQFECKNIDLKLEPVFEIMVKQYARSSADQANPLPHELRPTPVLVKTMNYMLKNIIYPVESNIEQDLANWYDFCWDRLRALRKDIVQQNLQNSEVITILEQIGRFHIVCYDLMLGYSGFDIKLNTENLNNCIQMLMPMYRDSDQQCPNEAEFVSYELLMHLGNPQFHTAYDLLPMNIKQSPQVRFCIKAHTIYLQSSDCIEFFELLKNTTFMNCCILQRVIPNIRFNNIQMMNMSYTTFKRVYKLEMKHFMDKLCFDDIQLAQEFCADIQLEYDDIYVDLSRKTILRAPELRRQKQEFLIIQKRHNLTFLISGMQNLPNVEISSVYSSFDDNDHFYDHTQNKLNEDLNNEETDPLMDTETSSIQNLKDRFSFKENQSFSTNPIQTPDFEIPKFTFKLPKYSSVQTESFNFKKPWDPLKIVPMCQDENPSIKSNVLADISQPIANNSINLPTTCSNETFIKPFQNPIHSNFVQLPNKVHFEEKNQFTQLTPIQMNLSKKYFYKWQNYVNCKKSKCIEEMFAHGELFHSECISSLSSSPSSEKSLIFNYSCDSELQEESTKWLQKQFMLANKYFYIWLRKVLRRRRKIEVDPVASLPWSVFMQVHGTPKETLLRTCSKLKAKKGKRYLKLPIDYPLNQNRTNNDDISITMANLFVKNVLNIKKDKLVGNKMFWKLAVNYGKSLDPYFIENKVMTIIYGKVGFNNKEVQTIYTDYNTYFIKSVQSHTGLQDWTKSGINAALVFTNTGKETMETFFKRVESILQSTPIAIPLVLIFSSTSDENEIENYQSVLDAYRENNYINNYLVCIWQGPKTILESIEFLSNNYVDITPGMCSENLFYNLLSFAQSFYLKVRYLLLDDNPNIIIEKYNQYLDVYIKRLGRSNYALRDVAPEFIPHLTQNPYEFSVENTNLNLKYFEDILNGAHLPPYESWPPDNVDDLINYVKNMCKYTNRRCWCLDMLQMLQLHRQADLDHCLFNASWYEVVEMWIEGVLGKCSNEREYFTVFYNGNPIADALEIVFPNNSFINE